MIAGFDRRDFLKYAGITFIAGSITGCIGDSRNNSRLSSQKPNVVICMIDQLRSHSVGCYGSEVVRTPNIDKLAGQGMRFEHAVTNNPVCMPARSALISGRFSRTCQGFLDNYGEHNEKGEHVLIDYPVNVRNWLKETTLPEILAEKGYETCLIGKWHIHPAPQLLGFDEFVYPKVSHRHTGQTFVDHKGRKFVADKFSPEFELDEVREYLSRKREKPFFLFYNISPPHMPLADAPKKYTQMYKRDEVKVRPNVYDKNGNMSHNEQWFRIYLWDYLYYREHLEYAENLPEGFDLRDLTAAYNGLSTWADDLVGGLMESLRENGLQENTIVVLLSDHGDMLGSHDRYNKQLLYEESIRIPFIIRGPGVKKAVCSDLVAQTVDVMPSVLGLCGIDSPDDLPGRDLCPVLTGNGNVPKNKEAYIEITAGRIGIRTLTHLYGIQLGEDLRTIVDDRYCFYDLEKDPYQLNNLAGTGEQSELAAELRKRLIDWHRRTPWMDQHV